MWALGTLWSRGHDFVRGSGQKEQFRCMLPGIDLLNMASSGKNANEDSSFDDLFNNEMLDSL